MKLLQFLTKANSRLSFWFQEKYGFSRQFHKIFVFYLIFNVKGCVCVCVCFFFVCVYVSVCVLMCVCAINILNSIIDLNQNGTAVF